MLYYMTESLARFLKMENSSSRILIFLTVISLIVANIPHLSDPYIGFWYHEYHFLAQAHLPHNISLIINDMLMPFFFFIVGEEIRYEITQGSLNTLKKSALPLLAALGGMVGPALIYSLFNKGLPTMSGWGIPTATDIAFSVAVVSMLGKKISKSAKVFLLALAIFDDLGAILVIALFYGAKVHFLYLILSIGLIVLIYLTRKMQGVFYMALLFVAIGLLWYAMHLSGIHVTVMGVVLAFILPEGKIHRVVPYIQRGVNYVILPLFVLANTAIFIDFEWQHLPVSVILGIILGLILGKPLGVLLVTRFSERIKLAERPYGMKIFDVIGVGIIAGIGFTMSIFVANLSFSDREHLQVAKVSVIVASLLAAVLGILWFSLKEVLLRLKVLKVFLKR